MSHDIGWFRYGGRRPDRPREFAGVALPLPRDAGDPSLVFWQYEDEAWLVDDDAADQYTQVGPDEAVTAVRVAWALGWLDPKTYPAVLLRRVGDESGRQVVAIPGELG